MADGRFAPSPTGPLHLGSLRTAMLAWLFARSEGSRFLLRIEDLDAAAAREEHVRSHQLDLAAIGVDWDEAPVRQSQRLSLYRDAIGTLDGAGLLYRCWCTRREIQEAVAAPHESLPEGAYPGTCLELSARQVREREESDRPAALRVRAEHASAVGVDRLRGRVEGLVDDFVVQRNDGAPAYNLAVVVDDHAQSVQEVVRGDDLLDSTPRQVWLARMLGVEPPSYAHVPLVLGADGVRLAKRHGAVTLSDLQAAGRQAGEVRDSLLGSAGLPAGPLPDALAAFDPAALPRAPWRMSTTP